MMIDDNNCCITKYVKLTIIGTHPNIMIHYYNSNNQNSNDNNN